MKIGFLVKKLDEDFAEFLNYINYEFVVIEKSDENSESFLKDNVKLIKTLNFEKFIVENDIKFLFIDKEIDFKSKHAINIKIIDNELEKFVFDYDNFAIRSKKIENSIYFPYFIDFEFFSNFYSKLKKYDKIKRITILTNSFDVVLVSFLEKLLELRKSIEKLNFIVYGTESNRIIPFVNFISRELNKKERAELYLNSDIIIAIEDRKKEILEAMAMKKIILTNDGFLGLPNINFGNIINKIERLLNFKEYEANQIIAREFSIKNASKIFEKELKDFIEIKIS